VERASYVWESPIEIWEHPFLPMVNTIVVVCYCGELFSGNLEEYAGFDVCHYLSGGMHSDKVKESLRFHVQVSVLADAVLNSEAPCTFADVGKHQISRTALAMSRNLDVNANGVSIPDL